MRIAFLAAFVAATLMGGPVERGLQWLASTQGPDGGWGQDGGATSHVRQGERLETNSNDVANTAAALLALTHGGVKGPQIWRGVAFLLAEIERAPEGGLAITDRQGSQIQRKLGPYIDTFLTSMMLSRKCVLIAISRRIASQSTCPSRT